MPWTVNCYVQQGDFNVATLGGLECIFTNIVKVSTEFALLALFVMLLAGGVKYLTSGGDPKSLQSAQNTITYAILGLVVLFLIWFILLFIGAFTGVNVTQFNLPKFP
jgi:hypothetical protein